LHQKRLLCRAQGNPTAGDKARLLLCYLATHPGRFDQQSRDRWAQLAQLSPNDLETICNVQYLGVELKKAKRSKFTFISQRNKPKRQRQERSAADAHLLENGRFQPAIADMVTAFVGGRLERGPDKEWAVVEADTEFDSVAEAPASQAASMGAKSMRTTKKPTWHHRKASSGGGVPSAVGPEQIGLRSRVVVRFLA
jgi:syntaxin-binding protein 1